MADHVASYDAGAIEDVSVSSWAITGVPVSVGETLLVAICYGGLGTATNRTATLADNLGNTYVEITLPSAQWYASNSTGIRVFRCQVTTGGTATITATPSANCNYTGIIVRKFSGGSSDEDGATCALENSTTPASGAIVTTVDGDIVVGFAINSSSTAGSLTATNGSFTGAYTHAATGFVSQYQIQASAGSVDSEPTVSASANWISAIVAIKAGASAAVDQFAYRGRNDNGSETTATWIAAQSTPFTAPLDTNIRVRFGVQATGDPASATAPIEYRKNAGSWTSVPVGASGPGTTPVIESGDGTGSSTTTASTSWSVAFPAASTGDLLLVLTDWDDSTNTTTITPPSGPNGESFTPILGSPQASASTEMRLQGWYTVATGSWTSGNRTFTANAAETQQSTVIKVPAGEFDAATPIGWANGRSSAGTAETSVASPTGTAGSSDGGGRLVIFYGSDADSITAPGSGTTTIRNGGATAGVGHLVVVRDAAVTNSESVAAINASIASDSWASLAFVVRAPVVTNEIYIATSTHITASGEATTQQLSGGTGSFVAGRIVDDENGVDAIDIGNNGNTEVEYCLRAQAPADTADVFEFRIAGLSTYTEVAEWTIGAGVGSYDVSLSESAAASDALSTALAAVASRTETLAPADTLVGALSVLGALAETLSPADTIAGGSAFASSLAETVSPADAASAALTRSGAMSEALATLDAVNSTMSGVAALVEAVSALDTPVGARVTSPSLAESISPTDSLAGGLTLLAALSESTTVAEVVASVQVAVAALVEAASAVVSLDAEQMGVISVSMAETFSASDAVASSLSALSALAETVALSDTVVRQWITAAGLAESVSPADVYGAARVVAAQLAESAAAVDSLSAIGVFSVQIAEAAALIDAPQAAALLSAALGEAITPDDLIAAIAASYPGDPRRTFTVSGGRGLVVQAGDRVVVVTRNDRTIH